MIVLDTNILSELMRPTQTPKILQWADRQDLGDLFTTAVCEAEILFGIGLLPAGRRKEGLLSAATSLFSEDFADRVLVFDSASAFLFAEIATTRKLAGSPISYPDAQIAAITSCNGAALATRNVADFANCGIEIINPWD